MEVLINQQPFTISEKSPLHQVLEQRGFSSAKGIAVAVNDSVVPRDTWGEYILQPYDKIMIIRATQGG
ncbi:sulfur carrier protein ThiS [Fulvivirga sp. 29W222]|uniref:Sulfur carrier protein ThiS n=1 Tax=Fulvivirga marina TaxID=2494733 RepID=A0A937FVL1_9BACT|nr:sulfur carrier protein ThiS [Fulvivirga marina]MBL6445155.1 sulfur carrier protein ThiS [Fulvivirga marina]